MSSHLPVQGSRFLSDFMQVYFYEEKSGKLAAELTLDERVEGPPGHVHGGFSASLIDEAMGGAVWNAGHQVVAVNISFDLKKAVPLGQAITVRGWVERVEGRKVFAGGEIRLADESLAVSGTGIFVKAPQFFRNSDRFGTAFRKADAPE